MKCPASLSAVLALGMIACSPLAPSSAVDVHERMDQRFQDEFHRVHAKYELKAMPRGIVRRPTWAACAQAMQVLLRHSGLRLELELRARRATGEPWVYRTASKYRLLDDQGKTLASAESLYATQDLEHKGGEGICVMASKDGRFWFIWEAQAWSTKRAIVMKLTNDASSGQWSVRYVNPPSRPDGTPFGVDAELLGIDEGRLIFDMDDRWYVMPLEKLETVESLEYTIG